jgi:hypothetical protein
MMIRRKGNVLTGISLLLALGSGLLVHAQPTDKTPLSIKQLFLEDHADPANATKISSEDWKKVWVRDEERREQTRELLAIGEVRTAEDFRQASFSTRRRT